MPKIGEKTIHKVAEMLETHLLNYQHEIEKAYCDDEGGLTISLSVKFGASGNSGVEVRRAFHSRRTRSKTVKQRGLMRTNCRCLQIRRKTSSWRNSRYIMGGL